MPPKAKAQPKPEQIEVLARWIEQGPVFDGEAKPVVVPDEPDEPKGKGGKGKGAGKAEAVEPQAGKGEAGKEDGEAGGDADPQAVQQLRDELVHVAPLAEGSRLLRVDFAATAPKVDDAAAERLLRPLCAHIGELSLARTKVTDATMPVVGRMRSLQRLDLRDTQVTAAGLTHLRGLKDLHDLVLVGTPLLDPAVNVLLELPALQHVYVWNTDFGGKSVARLRARAGLTVDAGDGSSAEALETEPEVKLAKSAPAEKAPPPLAINAVCPVSGKPVDPAITFVHEGKTIAFCCTNCLAKFQAEPARFPVAPK